MTVTPDQARMLATLATACRPNGARHWDSAGVMAALKQVADRSLPEVVMATIRAAADRDVDSPGVIPSAGSHWAESTSVRGYVPDVAPTGTRCTICGKAKDATHEGHTYTLPRPPDAQTYSERVAALRATLEPTSGPTGFRGLDDFADARPELHARVEALRAANPGLDTLPLQEPPPTPPQPEAAAETSETKPEEAA